MLCSFVLFVDFYVTMTLLLHLLTLKVTVDLDVCLHKKLLIYSYSMSVADRMCRSGAIDLICIDSVSALTPRAEIEVSLPLPCFFLWFYSKCCIGNVINLFFRVR